jgi:FtsH-binding integral membrane protein
MRSIVAFYRARPLVGVLVFALGLGIAVATAAVQSGGGVVLPIAFCALMGLIVGSVVAVGQRRGAAADDRAALDASDPRDADPS